MDCHLAKPTKVNGFKSDPETKPDPENRSISFAIVFFRAYPHAPSILRPEASNRATGGSVYAPWPSGEVRGRRSRAAAVLSRRGWRPRQRRACAVEQFRAVYRKCENPKER